MVSALWYSTQLNPLRIIVAGHVWKVGLYIFLASFMLSSTPVRVQDLRTPSPLPPTMPIAVFSGAATRISDKCTTHYNWAFRVWRYDLMRFNRDAFPPFEVSNESSSYVAYLNCILKDRWLNRGDAFIGSFSYFFFTFWQLYIYKIKQDKSNDLLIIN